MDNVPAGMASLILSNRPRRRSSISLIANAPPSSSVRWSGLDSVNPGVSMSTTGRPLISSLSVIALGYKVVVGAFEASLDRTLYMGCTGRWTRELMTDDLPLWDGCDGGLKRRI